MQHSLLSKNALVTGASRGIGAVTARALAGRARPSASVGPDETVPTPR